ncbi:MAG: hypothetical protein M1826_003817 [Phylliscum demangeonii]|nr:MAG: hypothetical protein M1826_003817 [Phylliscum demangeonii]
MEGRPPPSATYQEHLDWFRSEEGRGWKGVGRARKVWAGLADYERDVFDGLADWQACVDRFAPHLQPPIPFPFPTNTKLANMQYLEGEMDFDPAVLAQMDALSKMCAETVRYGYQAHWDKVDKLAAVNAAESEYPTAAAARAGVVQRTERYFARTDLGKVTKRTIEVKYQRAALIHAKLGGRQDEPYDRFKTWILCMNRFWSSPSEVPFWRYLEGQTFNAATTAQLDDLSDLCARAVRAGYDDNWARTNAISAADDAALARGQRNTVYTPYPTEAETQVEIMREMERALQKQGQGQSDSEHGVSKIMTKMTAPARRLLGTVDRRLVKSLHRLNEWGA